MLHEDGLGPFTLHVHLAFPGKAAGRPATPVSPLPPGNASAADALLHAVGSECTSKPVAFVPHNEHDCQVT